MHSNRPSPGHVSNEEQQQYKFQPPRGRMLTLMIKNISKESPLAPDEIEVSLHYSFIIYLHC